jgi:hypothetical protein
MSLARGDPIQKDERGTPAAGGALTAVIVIAPSAEERIRLARLVNDGVPVLLVSSREEAIALLGRDLGGNGASESEPTVLTSSQAAAARGPAVVEPLPAARTSRKRAHELVGESVVESVGIDIDSDWRVASWRDKAVPLSPLEHDLLRCLLGDLGRTLTFERLHRQVWGNDHLGGRSDLQSVVKRLRRKLRGLGSPLQIHAVRGVGLRLTDLRALPAAIALRSPGSGSLDDLPA